MMLKMLIVALIALAIGLAAGWMLREHKAINDCLRSEGKWLPRSAVCSGSPYGDMQI